MYKCIKVQSIAIMCWLQAIYHITSEFVYQKLFSRNLVHSKIILKLKFEAHKDFNLQLHWSKKFHLTVKWIIFN